MAEESKKELVDLKETRKKWIISGIVMFFLFVLMPLSWIATGIPTTAATTKTPEFIQFENLQIVDILFIGILMILFIIVLFWISSKVLNGSGDGKWKGFVGFLKSFGNIILKTLKITMVIALFTMIIIGIAFWINPDAVRDLAEEAGAAYLFPVKKKDLARTPVIKKSHKPHTNTLFANITATPEGVTFNTGRGNKRIEFFVRNGCILVYTPKGATVKNCPDKFLELPKNTYTNGQYFIKSISNKPVVVKIAMHR